MLLYVLSLLLIAAGLSFTFLYDSLILQTIGIAMSILGTSLLIVYYEQVLKKKNFNRAGLEDRNGQQNNSDVSLPESENVETNALKEPASQRVELFPKLSSDVSLEQRIELLRSYFENNDSLGVDYRRFFAELNRAAKSQTMRKNINDNFVTPLFKKLKGVSLPLEESDKQELLGEMMQLALIAIDYMQDYRSTFEGDDSLALRVASGTMNHKDAAEQATKATTNVYKTEKDVRVLFALVKKLELSDKTLIVHDTLLKD